MACKALMKIPNDVDDSKLPAYEPRKCDRSLGSDCNSDHVRPRLAPSEPSGSSLSTQHTASPTSSSEGAAHMPSHIPETGMWVRVPCSSTNIHEADGLCKMCFQVPVGRVALGCGHFLCGYHLAQPPPSGGLEPFGRQPAPSANDTSTPVIGMSFLVIAILELI